MAPGRGVVTLRTIVDGPANAERTFVFAHGAGAGMAHSFMNEIAAGLDARQIRVVRFEFPYMAARREGGRRGAPDRLPLLMESWRAMIRGEESRRLFIGGKSMGGRIATMVADEMGVAGVVCFGYPFHPPGKPAQLRTAHLETVRTPLRIIQGERDPFGTREEVQTYPLSSAISIEWLPDGDHSFAARKGHGGSTKENITAAIASAAAFILDT